MNTVSEELENILYNACDDFRSDYSGRGMFGDTCIGCVVNNTFTFIADIIREISTYDNKEELMEEFADMLNKAKTDSMGLDMIIYFPSFNSKEN